MTVFKRNGHWYFTKTINKKRTRKALPTARTKAQAEEAERKELENLHNATYGIKQPSTPFIEYAETVYLKWAQENKRSKNDKYYLIPIKAFFKRRTFEEIGRLLIEKYKSERQTGLTKFGKRRAPASINRELACISRIFNMAIEDGLATTNPCAQVKMLKEENQRTRYLTEDEQERLLAACTGERAHIRPIIILAINTGMRKGEILSLQWSQVDLSRGLIHLTRTKSGKSRQISINSEVREELLGLDPKSIFLFRNAKTGKALTTIKHSFRKACEEAGIESLRFHDLRHTAATRLADVGADPFTIAAILGHADLRMTVRYTHALESRKREALEKIAGFGNSGRNAGAIKKRQA